MAEAPKNAVRPMTPEEIRQAEVAEMNRVQAEAAERNATEGPAGGRYIVGADAQGKGGTLVNAEGEPIKEKRD